MIDQKKIFLDKSKIAFDRKHRKTLNHNISQYYKAVEKGKKRYFNYELARSRASYIKQKAVNNLSENLQKFEKEITSRGAQVLWARDSEEAIFYIKNIFKENGVSKLVKSKSMISEEIEFNENAEKQNVEPVETDLGEFIVQVAGEKPYHILTPAMHKSKTDVAELFNDKFNTPNNASAVDLTKYVRGVLRKKFTAAEVGVTGSNFIVADIGGIGLTENEGNGLMTVSFPKIHIVIAGIEKVVSSVNDLPLLFPLLSTRGTGQQITAYNTLLLGPRQSNENNGPEKMVVILLDNGRSEILQNKEQSKALKCIRCGACLNACPIYKNVGGYTYNTEYTGPIGSVITPFFKGFKDFGHLSFACTVCGRCAEVCPVKIPLHDLLLLNRKKSVEENHGNTLWNMGMKAYGYAFKKRSKLDLVNGNIKNLILKTSGNPLGKNKQIPPLERESFSKQWKNKIN